MRSRPNVTVLMTVRNGEPFLQEAVESILQQTYTQFRFLIIDNASTDGSCKIVQNFQDSRIDLVALPEDLGQTGALNYGLKQIVTPLVARIDADDVAMPHRLEHQVTYLDQHTEVALLGTWCHYIDENGHLIGLSRQPVNHQEIIDSFAKYDYNPLAHPSVMFRHQVIQDLGGYPTDYLYAQDRALWLRISYQHKISNLPEFQVKVRQHSNQVTRSAIMQLARRRDAVHSYQEILAHPDLSEIAKSHCRQTLARVSLDYAIALLQTKQLTETSNLLVSTFLTYPITSILHVLSTKLVEVIRALVGSRGRKIVYRLRRLKLSRQKIFS